VAPDGSGTAELSLRPLVEPVTAVDAATTCGEIDRSFRNRWTFSSIIVLPAGPGTGPGLVSRSRFLATMAGHRGYGRLQWQNRAIGELASWDAPTLRLSASLAEAVLLVEDSPEGYGDLLVVDDRGAPVGIVRPVRVMQALADRAVRQAATDPLTGVASRPHLLGQLASRLADVGTGTGAVVVAYVDLDRLKAVNDLLGHTWGDTLLRSVVKRIRTRLVASDVIGRLGGDEFAVVRSVPPHDAADAERLGLELGEELRLAVGAADARLPSGVHSRASVGIAVDTSGETSADALLHAADQAMYCAKSAGGDCTRLAGQAAHRPSSWAEDHRLEVVYQPIVDLATKTLVAVEALLRQRNVDGGLDGPVAALDEAQRAGMALDLDRWVLDRACRDMAAWQAELGPAAPDAVHVNLAADSLANANLVSAVLDTIDATGLPRNHVRLELSERAGVTDLEEAIDRLEEIARNGVRIALDDLGASLDTLRVLDRLPIDALKIDRSVVVGAGSETLVDTAMLTLLVTLARRLDLELVGEGVELAADESTLLTAGVHLMQGFRYSHPIPAQDLVNLLAPKPVPSPRPPSEPSTHASPAEQPAALLGTQQHP